MGLFNKENKDNKNENKVIDIPVGAPSFKATEKRLYLVDYENVSDAGLVGVDTLSSSDTVIIFYGSKVKSVAYESLIAITSSKATIEHLKAEKTAKNYLDFQLTTYLGYKLGKEGFDEICIISKDSGFDAVVDFWTDKGYTITRREAIVLPEKPVTTVSEEKPKRTYTRRTTTTSARTRTPRTSRPKVVTKPQTKTTKAPAATKPSKPTVTDKQKSEIRTALKDANLNAPDYKKVYDAFATSDNTSAYNNSLQKAFDNEKTSAIYQRTVKIFEKEHK